MWKYTKGIIIWINAIFNEVNLSKDMLTCIIKRTNQNVYVVEDVTPSSNFGWSFSCTFEDPSKHDEVVWSDAALIEYSTIQIKDLDIVIEPTVED